MRDLEPLTLKEINLRPSSLIHVAACLLESAFYDMAFETVTWIIQSNERAEPGYAEGIRIKVTSGGVHHAVIKYLPSGKVARRAGTHPEV